MVCCQAFPGLIETLPAAAANSGAEHAETAGPGLDRLALYRGEPARAAGTFRRNTEAWADARAGARRARSVAIQKLWPTLRLWRARRRQRQALWAIAESDDRHLLDDIGVSREA